MFFSTWQILGNLGSTWNAIEVGRRRRLRRQSGGISALESRVLLAAPNPLDLSTLNGLNGFRLDGIDAYDLSGYSASGAGDLNGDGFDDLIVGAPYADPDAHSGAGETYIVFGKAGFSAGFDLSTLNGANGFRLDGIDAGDRSGRSVSGAGDVNGDGFDDLIVGARYASSLAGEAYVVFGKAAGFTSSISLSSLNGTNGFRLDGVDSYDRAGWSVSGAGDVNGDGFHDVIVGAVAAGPGGDIYAGESYVVFGRSSGFAASIDLAALNGTDGFRLDGVDALDYSGWSVNGAGDVNGDGLDDLIVGAIGADPYGYERAGETYVVFGKSTAFAANLDLSTLNGTNGFRLTGIDSNDDSGRSVSGAGDVNGDGFDDLIVGADHADPGGDDRVGETYVVFGKAGGFSASLDLSTLDGANGFRLDGIDSYDYSGRSVSGAGDVNGDGFDDLIVGAFGADNYAGEAYVVFGKSGGFAASLDLSTLNGVNGFRLDGIDVYDRAGDSVSGAGDVNGDGFDDLIVGAHGADPGGDDRAGESYVIFGGNFTGGAETQVGPNGIQSLVGTQGIGRDVLVGGRGDDALFSDGGADVLRGGQGKDVFSIRDADFSGGRRIDGGTGSDTLQLDGAGLTLDLTLIPDNWITDIETIDISGSGANTLKFNAREVLNLSPHSNTLIVRRDGDDSFDNLVGGGQSWIVQPGLEQIGNALFQVLTQGAATLKVQYVSAFRLSLLSGTDGFRLNGIDANDDAGQIVASAGDMNADGFDDVIVTAPFAAQGSSQSAGEAYVVFGKEGGFPASQSLSGLTGANGFRLNGLAAFDSFGCSASGIGDMNGDGFADILIGAKGGDGGAGQSFVIFGGATFAATVDLAALDGFDGFRIDGTGASGRSVSGAGDVNGDGFDDLIVGAPYGSTGGAGVYGASYVVFGGPNAFAPVLDLSSLDGTNGFRIDATDAVGLTGSSVSGAGDVNGDGFDDVLIGAGYASPGGSNYAGRAWVVFGQATFSATLPLSGLNGTNGFHMDGTTANDMLGRAVQSVCGAGDVNGDGFDDVIVGGKTRSFVVFGRSTFTTAVALSALDGTTGLRLDGTNSYGASVGGAGDVNGDGFDDVIVGTSPGYGRGAVVYGKASGFPAALTLSSLNGSNGGFQVEGASAGGLTGRSVSGAGDVNGDGIDDLIVGSPGASSYAGQAHVVFGKGPLDLRLLNVVTNWSDTLTVQYEVRNAAAGQFNIGIYTSANTLFDAGDTLFASVPIAAAADRTVGLHSKSFVLGTDLNLPGAGAADLASDYRLLFVLDDANAVLESDVDPFNEDNKTVFSGVYHLAGGDVLAFGDDNAETITASMAGSDVSFSFGGTQATFAAADVASFHIRAAGGNDVVTASGVAKPLCAMAGAGNDTLTGGSASDTLTGGAGNDLLNGGTGSDGLLGGTGDDQYVFDSAVGSEIDTVTELGSQGTDALSFAGLLAGDAVTVNLLTTTTTVATHTGRTVLLAVDSQKSNWENLTGGAGNDSLTGNGLANVLTGNDGNDSLVGGAGNDTENGGNGNDTLVGSAGNDALTGGAGDDLYSFGAASAAESDTVTELSAQGTDTLSFASLAAADGVAINLATTTATVATHANRVVLLASVAQKANWENLTGGAGNDALTGNGSANLLTGNAGTDTLTGGAGNDTLTGGAGNDALLGGAGDDLYTFGTASAAESDTVTELGSQGTDTLNFSGLAAADGVTVNLATLTTTVATHTNRVVLLATVAQKANWENVTGGAGNDGLTGNGSANALTGNGGNDTLTGGAGNDSMLGGTGDDTYVFGTASAAETDTVTELANQGTDALSFFGLLAGDGVAVNLATATTIVALHTNRTVLLAAVAQRANWENLTGGAGNDTLTGNGLNNLLTGNDGNDTLDGGAGIDTLDGGNGTDTALNGESLIGIP